ncbi:MAG: hypothetical protein K2G27_05945 [Duncaniella sp.]|nr:hypothetical protein [Duncaniella sp.]
MIRRVSPKEYGNLFPEPSHVFDSVAFNELNREKCDGIHYLVVSDAGGKVRFGLILGERGDELRSPFSAPFGGLEARGRSQRVGHYIDAIKDVMDYGHSLGCRIVITLPPAVYDNKSSVMASQLQAALSCGATVGYSDYNYHYPLDSFGSFVGDLDIKVRQKFLASDRQGFEFEHHAIHEHEAVEDIYSIILANHTALGYPVRMSLDDIRRTSACVPMDFFMLRKEGRGVAGAMVYHTSPDVAQLIYWGDMLEYRALRPMNYFAYRILEYYHRQGKRAFDLGPSSSDGIPSLGLCDFKAGLGCVLTPKFTLIL